MPTTFLKSRVAFREAKDGRAEEKERCSFSMFLAVMGCVEWME